MKNQLTAGFIVDTLKTAIILKKNNKTKETKLPFTVFIDFVKLRFIDKTELAQNIFVSFYNDPRNLRVSGKLEAWIEIALRDNEDAVDDLIEKIEKVEEALADKKAEKITVKKPKKLEAKKTEKVDEKVKKEEHKLDDNYIPGNRPIIVTWDFSEVAKYALNHAIMYARTIGEEIILLHITKNDREIDNASKQMSKVVDKVLKDTGIKIEFMVETGNILKTITQIANDKNARFVIMGTHGIKGMQKFTGSLALKVIAGTVRPFIVVQQNPERDTIKTIVFPVDNRKESKQKLKQVIVLAKFYTVKYVLTVPELITAENTQKSIKRNLSFIKSYMSQQGIEHEVVEVAGTSGFAEAALKYSEKNRPDMIIILTTKNINLQDYLLGAEEQKIIANSSKIPVMCINPMKTKYLSMGFSGIA